MSPSSSELAFAPLRPFGNIAQVPLAGGAPRPLMDHVTWADWSTDGGGLAVVRNVQSGQQLEFPVGNVIYATSDRITDLRFSPRGDWLAFAHHHPAFSDGGSLEVVNRTGVRRVLSGDWADLYGVAWPPGGREVWFTAGRHRETKSLRAVTLDGQERLVARLLGQFTLLDVDTNRHALISQENYRQELTVHGPSSRTDRGLTWLGISEVADLSSDGREVLFTVFSEGDAESGQTYIRQTEGTPAVHLGEGMALALSPDGEWALTQLTSPPRLVLLPIGVGTAKTLKDAGLTYLGFASWFRDGRRVAFLARGPNTPPRVYVQDIDGGDPIPVGPAGLTRPIVAPDGRMAAEVTTDGPVLFSVDGSGVARSIPGLERGETPIAWSADGRWLYFTRERTPMMEIHRLELSSGRRNLVWSVAIQDPAGIRTVGRIRVTPDGKYYAHSFERVLSELYLVEGLK